MTNRLHKFVEYHHRVPPIDYATIVGWSNKFDLPDGDRIALNWLNCNVYSEPSIFRLNRAYPYADMKRMVEFTDADLAPVIFGSAKKHNKYCGRFQQSIDWFVKETMGDPVAWLRENATSASGLHKAVESSPGFGRLAAEWFVDCLIQQNKAGQLLFADIRSEVEPDWVNGSNQTSGMFNLLGMDKIADEYDKTGWKREYNQYIPAMNATIQEVKDYAATEYGTVLLTSDFISKLCSWRNLFKGTRYGGYHHDRQLEQIRYYQKIEPENPVWGQLLELRQEIFPHYLLGELNGWNGIRKERKKIWLQQEMTGAEIPVDPFKDIWS